MLWRGSILIAGAAIQWLSRQPKVIYDAKDSEYFDYQRLKIPLAFMLFPAFVGLGAPYWDMYARGAQLWVDPGTTRTISSEPHWNLLPYQTRDVRNWF